MPSVAYRTSMPEQTATELEPRTDPPSHLEQFASYEDGDDLVICDKMSPNTWIRSDKTVSIQA